MVAEVAEVPMPLAVPTFTVSSSKGWEMTLTQFLHPSNPPLVGNHLQTLFHSVIFSHPLVLPIFQLSSAQAHICAGVVPSPQKMSSLKELVILPTDFSNNLLTGDNLVTGQSSIRKANSLYSHIIT